jgi:hypothetical protein
VDHRKPNLKKEDKTMKSENQTKTPLLVTTAHRGVFFGYGQLTTDKIIRLENAQMCIYWTGTKGVLGLATRGPGKGCRIGPSVKAITLQDVVSITECTDVAEAAWKSQPWN